MRQMHLWLSGLILIGFLSGAHLWAQSPDPVSAGRSVMGSGARFKYRPLMPYPYPRVYVNPYVQLDPYAPPETDTPRRPSAAAAQGLLRLEVKPPEAEIYVDGNLIGRGRDFPGPALVPVWPGGHRVEFRWQGSVDHIRLFVAAGETFQISRDLSPVAAGEARPPAKRWSIPSSR